MAQSNWRLCSKCQGLFFGGNATLGQCPSGGEHTNLGSRSYKLDDGVGNQLQGKWNWCDKCQGLFHTGNATPGHCPAGGGHNAPSGEYHLNEGSIGSSQEANWRWCNRCQGLFFAGNFTTGTCPLGGGHNSSGSGNYCLTQDPINLGVCQPIQDEINSLKDQVVDLQSQISGSSTQEKQALVAEIKNLNNQIEIKKGELNVCKSQNPL